MGVDKFVLHLGIPFEDESERPDRLKCSMEFLNGLAEFAHREGAVIAVEEKHWFPKEGKIDWVSLMAKLYGSGHKGIWMYECKPMERTPQMFYDTAAEILRKAGVPETV